MLVWWGYKLALATLKTFVPHIFVSFQHITFKHFRADRMKAFFPAVLVLLCTFVRFASSDFSYLVFVEAQRDRIKGDICYVNNKCDEVSILVILVRRTGEETWRRKICREKAPVRKHCCSCFKHLLTTLLHQISKGQCHG